MYIYIYIYIYNINYYVASRAKGGVLSGNILTSFQVDAERSCQTWPGSQRLAHFHRICKKECIQIAVTDGGRDSFLTISGAPVLSHSSGVVCPFCGYLAAYVEQSKHLLP